MAVSVVTLEERLELEKNVIRGLFGQLKSRVPGTVDHREFKARKEPRADTFWTGLRRALISARGALEPSQYDEYFEWLRAQINASRHFREFPTPVIAMDGIFEARVLSAEAEVHWAVARLIGVSDTLNQIQRLAGAVDDLVAAGGTAEAVLVVDLASETLGASLWIYELSLALRQLDQGLEAQKAYSETIRAPLRRAGYSFVVSYASMRNEPRTTWPRFRDNVAERIGKLTLYEDSKSLIRFRLLRAMIAMRDGELDTARTELVAVVDLGGVIGAAVGNYWLAHILTVTGDREGAFRLLAAEAARIPDASAWLPVKSVIPTAKWGDFKPIARELCVCIVLDLSWRTVGDDRIATLRRFAFNAFLKQNGICRPSDLRGREGEFSHPELVYFLKNVCVASVMDMSSFFASSAEVDDEVLEVQEWLMTLDPLRVDEYQARVFELNNRKVILEGLKLVDSSRLYVDVDAIKEWSRRDFGEDFSRYVNLVETGIGVAADFDDMLRLLNSADHTESFEIPENEADAILVDLTKALLREFLHSSEHGLDSYLSRRVRHHPLTAALRGPLESAGLITTKDTEFGAYQENQALLARLPGLTEDCRDRLNKALADFSGTFDTILADLKEARFHTRSAEHPNGLFQVNLLPIHHYIIRSVVQLDRQFDDYLNSAFSVFWALLGASLTEARTLLDVEVRASIAEAFDNLQARLREIAGDEPGFPALASLFQDTAGEVQRKLTEVSDWFIKPEFAEATRTFTLGQIIDIGVKSALDPYKDRAPAVSVTVDNDIDLQAANVALLAEVLLVVLNNARQHGGIDHGQVIDIHCTANLDDQVIELCVSNQIDPAVRTLQNVRKIAALNKQIAAGNFERARVSKEGDSGFIKIAAVVYQSKKGSLKFGFEGEDRFAVRALYSLIILASA